MNISCVIFDLDGTLVDSEGLCNQVLLDLLPDLNCSLGEMLSLYRGQQLDLIIEDLELRLARKLPANFEQVYRAQVADLFDTELRTMPGVSEMLATIPYPMCVASSGPLGKIKKALSVSRLEHFFGDDVFSSYQIQSWKPEPDLFLHAAKLMGFSPDECAVIEDSKLGVQAGVSAGMHTIHYAPDGVTFSEYNSNVFSSMSELPNLLGCPPLKPGNT